MAPHTVSPPVNRASRCHQQIGRDLGFSLVT